MKKIKKSSIFIAIILVLLSSVCFYFGANYKLEHRLNYSEKGNMDYKVFLKENNDFETPFLEKDKKYIASLIDHIDIDYKYAFKSNYDMDVICKYYVLASAYVQDGSNEGKVIYQKDKYILESKTKEFAAQKEVNLNETVVLNYDEYNNIIKDFTSRYNLSSTKNTLDLSLCIELEAKNENFENPFVDESKLNATIPLTDQTLAVDLEYKEIDQNGTKVQVSSNKLINILLFIAAISSALLAGILITSIAKQYLKIKNEETKYQRTRNEILSSYNKVISKLTSITDMSSYEVADMNDFIDLANIRDCLDRPILFVELEKDKLAWFMVLDNAVFYRYILKDEEDEKNGEKSEI